jgi:diguanylate cyclase (GGDEF)-like protein
MQLRGWLRFVNAWICPLAPLSGEYSTEEMERIHISRLFPSLLAVAFVFLLVMPHLGALWLNLALIVLYGAMGVGGCVLLHYYRAVLAARIFVGVMLVETLVAAWQILLSDLTLPLITIVFYHLAVIFIAGLLLGGRATWATAGILMITPVIDLVVQHHPWSVVLQQGLTIWQLTLVGALFIAIGMGKFHESLHLASRTEELGLLNAELATSIAMQERTARQIEIMRAVAHACASAADEESVGKAALQEVLLGIHLTNGVLLVHDEARPGYARVVAEQFDEAVPAAAHDLLLARIQDMPITPELPSVPLATDEPGLNYPPVANDVLMQVLVTGEPCLNYLPEANDVLRSMAMLTCLTCVPMRFEGKVIGVLGVAGCEPEPRRLEQDECLLLLGVADEIATSLHRAYLYDEAHRLSLFDPLTNLYNHRAMQQIVQRELEARRAKDLPLALIMLDIDHFRQFNETYGHDVGDQALRAVARAIQSVVRKYDYAARYGGEEFVIVLPETGPEEAGEVAERLRLAITLHHLHADASAHGGALSLTASLGYAIFPQHASAATSLLKAADLALYAAKRAGRNTVVAYSSDLLQGSMHPAAALLRAGSTPETLTLPSGADLDAVRALITAIDLRDGYTAAHSDSVARFAVAIGTRLGLPTEHIETLRLGAQIHDVGKIGVPDDILRKPGKLTSEEWAVMRKHTLMGEAIVRSVEQLHPLLPLVRWHHERLDGSGYPDGLRGEEIPLLVRILSVADIFDAFTAERPYHPVRPAQDGMAMLRAEVRRGALDATIVAVFTELLIQQGLLSEQEVDLPEAA